MSRPNVPGGSFNDVDLPASSTLADYIKTVGDPRYAFKGEGGSGGDSEPARMVWAGAVTPTSFKVCFDVSGAQPASLVVSTSESLSNPVYTAPVVEPTATEGVDETFYPVSFTATGLNPNTTYYYAPVVAGVVQMAQRGRLKTFPAAGQPASFRFAFGSCSYPFDVPASGPVYKAQWPDKVFRAIAKDEPLFFIHLGDIDYSDVEVNDIRVQRSRNSRKIRRNPDFAEMCKTVPIAYIYDDHDFAGNDASLNSSYLSKDSVEVVGRNTRRAIRETTPIYPTVQDGLGEPDVNKNILAQQWDVGQVRFIMPDLRSQRRTDITPPTAMGKALGDGDYWDQLAWFLGALTSANPATVKQLFFMSSMSWNGIGDWAATFSTERRTISDTVQGLDVPVAVLCGDGHESQADDGANNRHSTDGLCAWPHIMSSPLSNAGVINSGAFATWNGIVKKVINNSSIYAFVDVVHDGSGLSWTVTLKGNPIDPNTLEATTLAVASSTDAPNTVQVDGPSTLYAIANQPVSVPLKKTFFGPVNGASVQWATNAGQSGTAVFKPNNGGLKLSVNGKAQGQTTTLTLSNPVRATLGSPSIVTIQHSADTAELALVLNSMTIAPDGARITLYNNYVNALIAAGVWAKMDADYLIAAHSEEAGRINLVNPGRYNLVPVNGPVFTVNQGYQPNGTNGYLTTQFNPSTASAPKYVRDSAHLSIWPRTNSTKDATDIGALFSSNSCRIDARRTDNTILVRLNETVSLQPANTVSNDFLYVGRSGASAKRVRRATTQLGTDSSASTGVPAAAIVLGCLVPGTNHSDRQYASASIGANLTDTEANALQAAKLAFLQGVGAA